MHILYFPDLVPVKFCEVTAEPRLHVNVKFVNCILI